MIQQLSIHERIFDLPFSLAISSEETRKRREELKEAHAIGEDQCGVQRKEWEKIEFRQQKMTTFFLWCKSQMKQQLRTGEKKN